jgi:hypothetical protein
MVRFSLVKVTNGIHQVVKSRLDWTELGPIWNAKTAHKGQTRGDTWHEVMKAPRLTPI